MSQVTCLKESDLQLRKHQSKVVNYMADPNHNSILVVHGVGSGKTLTAVSLMMCFIQANMNESTGKSNARIFVVTPTSLQENFLNGINQWNNKLKLKFKVGSSYDILGAKLKIVTITSFAASQGSCEKAKNPTLLIIDEAHNLRTEIRGEKGKYAVALLGCAHALLQKNKESATENPNKVVLLTATPVVNNRNDMVNLFSLLTAGSGKEPLGNYKCMISFYETPPDGFPSMNLRRFKIRMPPKYEQQYLIEEKRQIEEKPKRGKKGLDSDTGVEADLTAFYNGLRKTSISLSNRTSNKLMDLSPKMYWLLSTFFGVPCQGEKITRKGEVDAKGKYLANLQQGKISKWPKVVIYSTFKDKGIELIKRALEIAKEFLQEWGSKPFNYEEIHGSLSAPKRQAIVNKYNKDEIQVLVITKAAGEGLDLKETRYVVLVDQPWNPSAKQQIIGRAVRYGSHKSLPEEDQTVVVLELLLLKENEYQNMSRLIKLFKENLPKAGMYTKDELMSGRLPSKVDKDDPKRIKNLPVPFGFFLNKYLPTVDPIFELPPKTLWSIDLYLYLLNLYKDKLILEPLMEQIKSISIEKAKCSS